MKPKTIKLTSLEKKVVEFRKRTRIEKILNLNGKLINKTIAIGIDQDVYNYYMIEYNPDSHVWLRFKGHDRTKARLEGVVTDEDVIKILDEKHLEESVAVIYI